MYSPHAFEASKAIEVCQTTVNFENTIHFIMRRGVGVNPVAGRNVDETWTKRGETWRNVAKRGSERSNAA